MDKARLISLIQDPEQTTPADTLALTNLIRTFPFFQTAHLLLLYNLRKFDEEVFGHQLRESAIFVADRKVLFNFLQGNLPGSPQIQHAEQKQTKVIEKTIKDEPLDFHVEENKPILIIDAIPDSETKHKKGIRAELLEIDETPDRSLDEDKPSRIIEPTITAEPLKRPSTEAIDISENEPMHINDSSEITIQPSQFDIIDKFIEENPAFKPNKIDQNGQHEDVSKGSITESEDLATETLALIYTSQKLFPKAISVYEKLILKFPEKSTYFASRIKDLKKNIK